LSADGTPGEPGALFTIEGRDRMKPATGIDMHAKPDRTRDSAPAKDPVFSIVPSYTEALVDPGGVFGDPAEIVEHPWFADREKRTILLSWARDELVLEQVANRSLPELKPRSRIDGVIEALCAFDPQAAAEYRSVVASIRAQRKAGPPGSCAMV